MGEDAHYLDSPPETVQIRTTEVPLGKGNLRDNFKCSDFAHEVLQFRERNRIKHVNQSALQLLNQETRK